jgi:acetolactate synthase-1/2/3 large subunit
LHYFFSPQHENYRLSSELAAMGWGIGAAVGTAFATPKTPVVCLVGDGGFLMNGQEITVAVEAGLTVIYLILNDRTYGMVQHRHRQVSNERIEFAVPPVDFSAMAQAMGADGHTVRTVDDLQQLDMDAICQRQGPTVLDLYIDPDVIPPMGMF